MRERKVVLGLLLLVASMAFVATRLDLFSTGRLSGNLRDDPAPELRGISGWINTEPLTLEALRSKVVLIDFWTYSCVNCVRTFPFLRTLYDRYRPAGLEIVGVHSPEFSFERDADNVRAEVRRNGIEWPVALDNRMLTWRAYRNRFWPRVYLIDRTGRIRFDHAGEGGEDLIESRVRQALAGPNVVLPAPVNFTGRDFPADLTPETYLGWERGMPQGSLANPEGYRRDQRVDYREPEAERVSRAGTGGRFFLAGAWRAEAESVVALEAGARLVVPFRARDLFVVAGPASGMDLVEVALDGRPIAMEAAGRDVRGGVLRLDRVGLYRVVALDEAARHVLTLTARSPGARFYTFTFG